MSVQTTLSIESTCDDTSVAIVTNHNGYIHVHRMLTYSQIIHTTYGWIVPEFASRKHAEWLPKLIKEIWIQRLGKRVVIDFINHEEVEDGVREYFPEVMHQYGVRDWEQLIIDSITVASHPWLPGSLISGVTVAHVLSNWYDLPLHEVDHIMWHAFSVVLDRDIWILELPYLCLTVSGGHSDMYIIDTKDAFDEADAEGEAQWAWHKHRHTPIGWVVHVWAYAAKKITQTMDDAVGEVFDKVSVMLWGPYPGGLRINQHGITWQYDEFVAEHIRPIHVWEQFSFSWIKAQVKAFLEYIESENIELTETLINNIAWRFQECATDALMKKLTEWVAKYQPRTIGVVGWVSANSVLRQKVENVSDASWSGAAFLLPASMRYCVDNAAMIAVPWLLA